MNGSGGPGPRPGTETQATAVRRSRQCPDAVNDKQVEKGQYPKSVAFGSPPPVRFNWRHCVIICGIICVIIASCVRRIYPPLKRTTSARSLADTHLRYSSRSPDISSVFIPILPDPMFMIS